MTENFILTGFSALFKCLCLRKDSELLATSPPDFPVASRHRQIGERADGGERPAEGGVRRGSGL